MATLQIVGRGDPLFLSRKNADTFYQIVNENLNSPEFVIERSVPSERLVAGIWNVAFIYDVALFGKHLCTIYETCHSVPVGKYMRHYSEDVYEAETVEIQGNYYDIIELMDYDSRKYFGDKIVARWERDEKKRIAELNQKTNTDAMAFLGSFAKEKQYQ